MDDFEKQQADIRKQILSSYKSEKLLPFIGAGFSENIEGCPDWQEVLDKLSAYLSREVHEHIHLKEMFKNPNEAMEYFVWKTGNHKDAFEKIIDEGKKQLQIQLNGILEKFRPVNHHPESYKWKQHTLLVQKFKTIFTTNWDEAIEIACEHNYYKFYSVGKEKKIVDKNNTEYNEDELIPGKHHIIKYHGDSNEAYEGKSLVACEIDYFRRIKSIFSKDGNPIDNKLMKAMKEKDFLFLGYSFSDPNVKYILHQLDIIIYQSPHPPHSEPPKMYWILPDYSEITIQYYMDFLMNRKRIFPYFLLTPNESLLKQPKHKNELIKTRIIGLLNSLT